MLSLLQMNKWMNESIDIISQEHKTGTKQVPEYVQFSRLRMSKAELLGARSTSHQHCELCSFLQRKFWGALSVQSSHERTQGFSIFHATFWCKSDQRTRNEVRLMCAKFKVERTFFLGVWRWRYARISQTTPFFLPHGISAVPAPPALTTNHTISFS